MQYIELFIEFFDGISLFVVWFIGGCIEVDNLVVGYVVDMLFVFKGFSFSINSNERVGVVGCIGVGKLFLILVLFCFLEVWFGVIYIDGIEILKIKLYDL